MQMKQEVLFGRYAFDPGPGFPLSTDTMVLADFVHARRGARIADLGSAAGALGLLLCARLDCTVTGWEIQPEAHAAALDNIARNRLQDRMASRCGDLRQIRGQAAPGQFDCAVSNPPYFALGVPPQNPIMAQARQEVCCNLSDLFAAAGWLLRFGGDFFLIHKPERLTDLLTAARASGLEPKVLQPVRQRASLPVSSVLLQCRKGGKPGLAWRSDLILQYADGTPTPRYREIYHMEED